MIISVGYRVNSKRGIAFRKWATNLLKECLIKGYSINLHCFYKRLHSKIIL
ncbi:unknown [Rickettsia conorii str. Malish 7]|uniref:Virulence protein n=2 Tax=Rickettsia conorii TaxID=781 RepID=Q92GM8_RICCN|nr:unknown [Rickettsia conorii str. Malish 7]